MSNMEDVNSRKKVVPLILILWIKRVITDSEDLSSGVSGNILCYTTLGMTPYIKDLALGTVRIIPSLL